MTVLQKRDARGIDSKRSRGLMVGVAMAVIGLAAAFGISQLIDNNDTAAAGSPVATLHTQAPAYAQPSQSPVATLGGEAPAYAQDAVPEPASSVGATSWQLTPQQELAIMLSHTGYQPAATKPAQLTVEQERALVEARTGVPQTKVTEESDFSFTGPR